ncbi:MAG: FG-GAP repeat protein [Acidobacteria bacterium]|nr:FG-GAP repeat protein [Acidobacteriota bacterium]
MQKALLISTILIVALASACSFSVGTNSAANNASATNANANATGSNSTPAASPAAANANTQSANPSIKCDEAAQSGKKFIKSQSFPFDLEPFRGSCFVTFASKEEMVDERDVPRGSTFYIYKDGKQVFQFPDAIGAGEGCWVEAVGFNDLNGDGKTDVIIAGSCLGAKSGYPSNAVYVNTGKAFTTKPSANEKLDELKTVADIEAFVKKNSAEFF